MQHKGIGFHPPPLSDDGKRICKEWEKLPEAEFISLLTVLVCEKAAQKYGGCPLHAPIVFGIDIEKLAIDARSKGDDFKAFLVAFNALLQEEFQLPPL